MYLKNKIDEFFEIFPKVFTSKIKNWLKALAKNESKINYKNLFYKIIFPDGKFYGISFLKTSGDFFKKIDTLYSLLEDLELEKRL